MKKTVFLAVCSLVTCMFLACGEKKITVKNADGTEYESYQECCAAQDFQAAHQYLAKLKNSEVGGYDDAEEYVFKQEALYLMSQGDDSAKKRILFLLKEEEGTQTSNRDIDDRISMLVDLAITNDDEEFAKLLATQFKSSDRLSRVISYFAEKGTQESIGHIADLVQKMGLNASDKETISILASLNNTQLSDAIIGLISKKEVRGRRIPKGFYNSYVLDYSSYWSKEFISDYANYYEDIRDYNNFCSSILDIAINSKNNYIAYSVLPLFKEDVYKLMGANDGDKAPDGTKLRRFYYYVYYTNDSKNEARKKYLEAKNSGVFN